MLQVVIQRRRKSMTIERESEEQYRYRVMTEMFESDQQILKALKRVDRARANLIAAQNNLATVVTGANDYTRETFGRFYNAGGVTADDWKVDLGTSKYQRSDKIARGQLRLVQGGCRGTRPPRLGGSNGGPEAVA
jgi:hypothetical protein